MAKQSVEFGFPQLDEAALEEISYHLAKSESNSTHLRQLEYRGLGDQKTQVELQWYGDTRTEFEIDYPWKGVQLREVQADLYEQVRTDTEYQELVHCLDNSVDINTHCHSGFLFVPSPHRETAQTVPDRANKSVNLQSIGIVNVCQIYLVPLNTPLGDKKQGTQSRPIALM